MNDYLQQEKERIAKLPLPLKMLQEQCGKAWYYLNLHYPWYPDRYKDENGVPNHIGITGDGLLMVRLIVLDTKTFNRLRIAKVQEATEGWREYTMAPDWDRRFRCVLNLKADESVIGQEIDLATIAKVVGVEVDVANSNFHNDARLARKTYYVVKVKDGDKWVKTHKRWDLKNAVEIAKLDALSNDKEWSIFHEGKKVLENEVIFQ